MITSKKILCTLAALALVSGCQNAPRIELESEPSSGLHNVLDSGFKTMSLVAPEMLREYTAIYFAPLELSHLTVDTRKLDRNDKDWPITDDEKNKIQTIFNQSLSPSLKIGSLQIAREPGARTVTATVSLNRFTPNAPKDDPMSRMNSPDIYTFSVGDLDLSCVLKDSQTGKILGSFEDSKMIGNSIDLEKNDRINNSRKLKITFDRWLSDLSAVLSSPGEK